jgi:outer membrane murein-binding lipoprotein Lpp
MDTVTWTDDKIDALDGKVDALATRVDVLDGKMDALAKETLDGFARAEVEYTRTDVRFEAVNQQLGDLKVGQAQLVDGFDALQRTLIQIGFGLAVGLIAGIMALVGVIVTLLLTQ